MYYLHIKALDGDERRVALHPGRGTIGRSSDNAVVLGQFGVSNRHAEFEVRDGRAVIRDLGSTNGTFVNGHRVSDSMLTPGDRILIGSVLLIVQEAISDRVLLQPAAIPSTDGDRPRPEPRAPRRRGRRRRASARQAAPVPRVSDSRSVLTLLDELMTDDQTVPDDDCFLRYLQAMVRFFEARAGFVLGLRHEGGFRVRASWGMEDEVVVDRAVIERACGAGVPVLVEGPTSGPVSLLQVCLPLAHGDEVAGVIYLLLPESRRDSCRRMLSQIQPVLSAVALAIRRREVRGDLQRRERALAGGAQWPALPSGEALDDDLLGHSPQLRALLRDVEGLSKTAEPVLLIGEPGSGADQVARRIHLLGDRRHGPFLQVNCATLAPSILERELFGSDIDLPRGGSALPAKIALTDGGSLFLDEIADLPAAAQKRLLHLLERDECLPIGRQVPRKVDVRLLLGTRARLEDLVAGGAFHRALFEELRGRTLRLPPLRERAEDIVPLAQHMVRRTAAVLHKRILGLSAEACAALRQHLWKGNLDELRHVVERAVLLAEDEILDLDTLSPDFRIERLRTAPGAIGGAMAMPWKEAKLAFERLYLEGLLSSTGGNVAKSARHAGIARKNFYYKLRQHGLLPGEGGS